MSRWKRNGLLIIQFKYDHAPKHVHVFDKGREVAKFNIESWQVMSGKMTSKIKKALEGLRQEGKIK